MNNKLIITISILFLIFLCTCKTTGEAQSINSGTKYTAYYFHRTARCQSCLNLETYTKELIETKFSKKNFSFISINVEDQGNEHFEKDYNLEFSSVILVKYKNDEQIKWKNLDSIWSFTGNKDKFFEYAESEINNFMK